MCSFIIEEFIMERVYKYHNGVCLKTHLTDFTKPTKMFSPPANNYSLCIVVYKVAKPLSWNRDS